MEKNKSLGLIFLILVLVLGGLFYYYLTLSKKTPQPTPPPSQRQPVQRRQVVRRPEELPKVETEKETGKGIVVVPVTFVVDSISASEIVLKKQGGGEGDIITYPKSLNIKVRTGVTPPEKPTALADIDIGAPADLGDVAVGKTIKVINYNQGEAIYFYILE